jgi:hypothetical protein|tara:strand:+ start:118 stop:309 length:192 start_codon:yes stop_codon:yes gene_type:complete
MSKFKKAKEKLKGKNKVPFCVTVSPDDREMVLALGDGRLTKGFNILLEIVREDLKKELSRKVS